MNKMLYIAHFSFQGPGKNPRHGSFACLEEADDVEACLDKCRSLIADLHRKGDLGGHLGYIYLDVLVQVKSLPRNGLLNPMITRPGPLIPSKSISLPADDGKDCEAFSLSSDSEGRDGVNMEPFMTLA